MKFLRFILLASVLLAGCTTNDRTAFYTSALIQEAWFAIQAEPSPDAWAEFDAALLSVPAEIRDEVREIAIKEARARAGKN